MNYELEISQSLPAIFDTLSAGEMRHNYIPNPALVVGASTWNLAGNATRDATLLNGSPHIRIERNATQGGIIYSNPFVVNASPGEKWTFSVYASAPAGVKGYLDIDWLADGLADQYSNRVALNGVVNGRVSGTITVPASGARRAVVRAVVETSSGQGVLQVTQFLLERSPTAGSYFDGSTAASNGLTYSWLGTANQSDSVGLASASPLVSGSGTSAVMANPKFVPSTIFNKNYENISFTLEAWFRPLTNTGEIAVMGHYNEGVIWNGTSFTLRVRQVAGVIEKSWTPAQIKAYHLAFVYVPGQAMLYVDGLMVLSLTLAASPLSSTETNIVINSGVGSGIYDSFAIYARALSGTEIGTHYLWGKSVRSPVQTAAANGGSTWNLMHGESDIYATERFDAANWDLFFLNGLGIIGGLLTANEGGGTWMGMVPLSAMIGGVTAGVSLTYEGLGVVLSYSTDGATWVPVLNGAVILEDVDVTNVNLLVRIDLPDEGWVEHLTVSILNDRVLSPASGNMDLVYKSVIMDHENPQSLDYTSDWGAKFGADAEIIIPVESGETPGQVGTTEMWVKIDQTGTSFTLIDGQTPAGSGTGWLNISGAGALDPGAGGQTYVNGVARSSGYALTVGVWNHIVFVETAPTARTTYIGRPRQVPGNTRITVGHVALYPTSMNASEVASLYAQNVGAPLLRINDASGATLTEQATPVAFYAQNWSFVSTGS